MFTSLLAPVDAAKLPLLSDSIDFHISYNVFEHIPPAKLKSILVEAYRILNDEGLSVNRIDYSDHFSHSDKSISAINFLQFSDSEWNKIAGNRYMYMNRLRVDDFERLYQQSNHSILALESNKDPAVSELLKTRGIELDDNFKQKTREVLETTNSWIVSKKCVKIQSL